MPENSIFQRRDDYDEVDNFERVTKYTARDDYDTLSNYSVLTSPKYGLLHSSGGFLLQSNGFKILL